MIFHHHFYLESVVCHHTIVSYPPLCIIIGVLVIICWAALARPCNIFYATGLLYQEFCLPVRRIFLILDSKDRFLNKHFYWKTGRDRFEQHGAYEMFQELKMVSKLMLGSRDMKSPTSSTVVRWRRIVMSASTYSKCLGCTTACPSWTLTSRMRRSLTESFSCFHRATRALRWTSICRGWKRPFLKYLLCWNQQR